MVNGVRCAVLGIVTRFKSNALLLGVTIAQYNALLFARSNAVSNYSYFFTVTSNTTSALLFLLHVVLGNGPSIETVGFCIYISDFSILCIHILTQLTKERVGVVYTYTVNILMLVS